MLLFVFTALSIPLKVPNGDQAVKLNSFQCVSRGDRVELRGFGAFTVKHRTARQGRNPRTGETVFVEEKYVPFFKTGKELRERLNRGYLGASTRGAAQTEVSSGEM